MSITVRGKNIEVTVALKEYVEKNAVKLTRYFDSEVDVQAVLSVEKGNKTIVEITAFVEGIVLRAVDTNTDMYAAIDLAFDKIVRQIHKYKTRLAKRFKDTKTFRTELAEAEAVAEAEEAAVAQEIVKRKKFATRPMTEEEAILQMNLIGHNFFMFLNAETNQMNVIYRRNDRKYGILIPEE